MGWQDAPLVNKWESAPKINEAGIVGQQELGEPGLDDVLARVAMAAPEQLEGKRTIFKKFYPEGDLIRTPVSGELLYRKDPSAPYAKVDAGMFEKFEPGKDLLEFIGADAGAIIGEIATSTPQGRGAGIVKQILKVIGGTTAGDAAQEAAENVAIEGENQSMSDIASQSVTKGVFAGGGYGAAKALEKSVINPIKGGGFFDLLPGAQEGLNSAKELGLPNPPMGNLVRNPLIQKLQNQSRATANVISKYEDFADNEAIQKLVSLTNKDDAGSLVGQNSVLAGMHRSQRNNILSQISTPKGTLHSGGEALIKGRGEYSQTSQELVSQLYNNASKIEQPLLDIRGLQSRIDGALGPSVNATLKDGTIKSLDEIDPEILSKIELIKGLDPKANSVEVLQRIRQDLSDLSAPDANGVFRKGGRVARAINKELKETIENPLNNNKSFLTAWKQANSEAAHRFDTLESMAMVQIAKSDSSVASELVENFIRPGSESKLRLLRSTISNSKFADVQEAWKAKMLMDPDNVNAALSKYDPATKRLLISPTEERAFKTMGDQLEKLNRTGIKQALDSNTRVIPLVEELLINNNTSAKDAIFKMAQSDPASKRALRAGLMEYVVSRVLRRESTKSPKTIIDPNEVNKIISELDQKGIGQFLGSFDRKTLTGINSYAPFLRPQADTGASMQAGQVAGGLGLTHAIWDVLIRNNLVGYMMTSPKAQTYLIGTGKPKTTSKLLADATAVAALAANHADQISDQEATEP